MRMPVGSPTSPTPWNPSVTGPWAVRAQPSVFRLCCCPCFHALRMASLGRRSRLCYLHHRTRSTKLCCSGRSGGGATRRRRTAGRQRYRTWQMVLGSRRGWQGRLPASTWQGRLTARNLAFSLVMGRKEQEKKAKRAAEAAAPGPWSRRTGRVVNLNLDSGGVLGAM